MAYLERELCNKFIHSFSSRNPSHVEEEIKTTKYLTSFFIFRFFVFWNKKKDRIGWMVSSEGFAFVQGMARRVDFWTQRIKML